MKPIAKQVILLPEYHRGYGTGHVFRAFSLLSSLKDRDAIGVTLCIAPDHPVKQLFPEHEDHCKDPETLFNLLDDYVTHQEILFVLDKPHIAPDQVHNLFRYGKVLGIDPGGGGRKHLSYIIDTLPNLYPDTNYSNPWVLPLPELPDLGKTVPKDPHVLISLGGEDGAGITKKLLLDKTFRNWLGKSRVDILLGPSFRDRSSVTSLSGSWRVIPPTPNLAQRLKNYDLVVTIFGLTAFEALASGVPVVVVHPTKYHKKLARLACLPDLHETRKQFPNVNKAINDLHHLVLQFNQDRDEKRASLSSMIEQFSLAPGGYCPLCGTYDGNVLLRTPERTFCSCPHCGVDFQILFVPQQIHYSPNYFLEDYKKQYGKTYLEDFDAISLRAKDRVTIIQALLQKSRFAEAAPWELLDVGCAYGPFISQASKMGFQAQGVDISREAIEFVREHLGLPGWVADIRHIDQTIEPWNRQFHGITLWYVIEHFEDLRKVLTLLQNSILPGGVLALSTPSGRGITRKRREKEFFRQSPMDHYSIWNPRQAVKTLKKYGFKVKHIRCSSFHPDRYPWPLNKPIFHPLTKVFQQIFLFGDTMEIYAVKINTRKG